MERHIIPRRIVLVSLAVGVLVAVVSLPIGFVVGVLVGEGHAYHRRFIEERDALAPILRSDPTFSAVEIDEYSAGGAYLSGEVETEGDFGRLSQLTCATLGEARGKEALGTVRIRQKSTTKKSKGRAEKRR